MPRKSSQSGGVGPRPEVVRTGFGVVFSAGICVAGQGGGSQDGEGGGVEGDEIAVAGVGVAFDDLAGVVGKGGRAVLLIAMWIELSGSCELADEFVDVAAPGVFGRRRGCRCASRVVGDDLFAGVGEDGVAGVCTAGGFADSPTECVVLVGVGAGAAARGTGGDGGLANLAIDIVRPRDGELIDGHVAA